MKEVGKMNEMCCKTSMIGDVAVHVNDFLNLRKLEMLECQCV